LGVDNNVHSILSIELKGKKGEKGRCRERRAEKKVGQEIEGTGGEVQTRQGEDKGARIKVF
jgi:hypothetical protein